MVNDPVVFEWNAIDVDGDVLSCTLDADGDGQSDFTSSSCNDMNSAVHFYGEPGDYTAILTVLDQSGANVTSEFANLLFMYCL